MRMNYPIVMSEGNKYIVVYIPDFNINTQGQNYADAMTMAQDAIGLMGIVMEDNNEALPAPSSIESIKKENETDRIEFVEVDFAAYRKQRNL